MSIIKLLDEFTSENLLNKKSSRRDIFGTFGSLGKKAAIAAVPFGLATSGKARAAAFIQQTGDPIAALQLALTLEYLEAEFYMKALESGVLEGGSREEIAFMQISKHENAHVAFLVENLGENSIDSPEFDFTADGAFDPFNDNGTGMETANAQLLALAQAFEDTGVRAYKGQAANLMGTPFLQPALQIHSVEARHASEIRRIRGLKGWIVRDNPGAGMPPATEPVYAGEDNVMQAGANVSTISSNLVGDPVDAATEAFDEPLTADEAVAIASLFIVSGE